MEKTVVITGVSGGIGSLIAKAFNGDGYSVIGIDKKKPNHNHCHKYFEADIGKMVSSPDYFEKLSRLLFGEIPKLNTLVNNAALQILGSVKEIKLEDWQNTIDVNLTAPFILSKMFLERLEAEKGSIINISSIHAAMTKPKFIAYATSKAALIGLTQAMAVDLGDKVRVNSISPAAIETPMLKEGFNDNPKGYEKLKSYHPIRRIGKPEEIANLCLFLASDKSNFVSGANFEIDGAISKRLHDPD